MISRERSTHAVDVRVCEEVGVVDAVGTGVIVVLGVGAGVAAGNEDHRDEQC